MSRIKFITRFVAYFPNAGDRGGGELAEAANAVGKLRLELLRREPYLLAVAAPASSTPWGPNETMLDVFPGTAASKRMATRSFDDAESIEEIHHRAEASAQCYNLLEATNSSFLLESDALGLKAVYTARTAAGNVMASRIADALRLFPALAEPVDTVALYELLGFWAPLEGRTLYRRIRRTLPGAGCRWTAAGGWSQERVRDLQPVHVEPLQFMDRATATIREAAMDSLQEKVAGAPEPLTLALSGGFDSRFVAALCHDLHIGARALSYARRHHKEWSSTQAVARSLGIELNMLRQHTDTTLRYLPDHLDATEGTTDSGAVSIMNLLAAPTVAGTTLLHGFWGDLLSGGHMSPFRADAFTSRDSMADAIVRHWCPASAANLKNLFTPAPDLDAVRQDVLDGLRSDGPPYQAYLLWYSENRNRRYVASHFAVLGEHLDVVMPFYDRRLFQLWFSLPPIALTDRFVLRRLFTRYYPALARIPHPEEPAPIIPNLRWQLARLRHDLPRRALARCIGPERAQKLLRRLYRDDDFRSLSKLAAPQQQAYMLSRLAQLRPILRETLGVGLSPHYETILHDNLQALRTMFTVASYAERRLGQVQREAVRPRQVLNA